MNKTELINAMVEQSEVELTRAQAKAAVESFLNVVSNAMANGDKVMLVGFGSFETKVRPERDARNPHTGESIHVAASKAPVFKPGKPLKDAVNK